ncbi:MAG: amylo-alpha-1,6-glucosidase, partial [Nanoarchaeota archaeon]
YQLSRELPVELFFDVRLANDFRQWGRYYRSYEKEGVLVVEFTKKTNSREDSSDEKAEFSVFVAVMHDGFVSNSSGDWVRRSYSLNAKRNSASERYVYKAATIEAKNFVISTASSAAAAIKETVSAFKSIDRLKKDGKKHYDSLCSYKSGSETAMAANSAAIALDKLETAQGLYAGLPWFFQEWTRDELISSIALPAAARKRIVLKYLDKILEDGRLPAIVSGSYEGSPSTAADGIGWLFKRASEFIEKKAFRASEITKVKAALKKSIDALLKNNFRNGFIFNGSEETWMDTEFNDDGRKGACIEIQAMQLNMYNLMCKLSKTATYKKLEQSLLQNVRRFFWNSGILADRLNDFTVRPNIFIAAYVYPQLLSRKEWEICFDTALQRLWLPWGGLATIDKSHPNFRSSYTGETNESYHRGDSWFWINNIAAIVMVKINKRKFKSYIEKIAAASANDILWKGAVGCGSELSSASSQKAEGCLNQAWSNATFIELIANCR